MRHLYTISELTEMFKITTRTLRYYEEIGLIMPRRRGTQRLYSQADRARIQLILRARRLGFGLEEIRELLELYDTDPSNVTHLEDVLNRGNRKIREVEKQLHDLQILHEELLEVRDRVMQALDDRKQETEQAETRNTEILELNSRRHAHGHYHHSDLDGHERTTSTKAGNESETEPLLMRQSESAR